MTFTWDEPKLRLTIPTALRGEGRKRDTKMNGNRQTTLFWTALTIGLVWAVYSQTADLVAQFDRLKQTLFICGNTWLIKSVI